MWTSDKSRDDIAPITERTGEFHATTLQNLIGTGIARAAGGGSAMSLVRLLGFTTLACGCVVGRYREVATSREVTYVEEKGKSCGSHGHRRNHTVAADRLADCAAARLRHQSIVASHPPACDGPAHPVFHFISL